MERRVILAIVLMMIVAIAPSLIWPRKQAERPSSGRAVGDTAAAPGAADSSVVPAARPPARPTATRPPPDTVWVTSDLYRLGFSTHGGRLVVAELLEYHSFARADTNRPVQIVPPGRPMLDHRLVVGADTLPLGDWDFTPGTPALRVAPGGTLDLTARRGDVAVALTYRFAAADYRFDVEGTVSGLSSGGTLLVALADGLRSAEADSADDYRRFTVVAKRDRTEGTALGSFDPGERRALDGQRLLGGVGLHGPRQRAVGNRRRNDATIMERPDCQWHRRLLPRRSPVPGCQSGD